MYSDKKLWEDFKAGEKYALSHIYYQNIQFLYRYGSKFSNNEDLIKDTLQDLFFDLIRLRSNLGANDNIKFYLITAFRRKLFRNLKKQKITDEKTDFLYPEAQIVYSAEYEMIGREELSHREKLVQKALAELSPKQREILYYRYTCDFEYNQICELMDLKYDSARKLVFRSLQSLKKQLSSSEIILFYTEFLSAI